MITKRFTKDWRQEFVALVALGIPVSLAHIANMSMQLVDIAFVGRLGPEAIGGVSIGSAIFSTIMVAGLGLSLGLDFLISRAHGAGDLREARRLLIQGMYLSILASIPSVALMYVGASSIYRIGMPAAVAAQAAIYLRAVSWSLLPWLMFGSVRQYLQSTNSTISILVVLVLANLMNALGNWIFVFGHWGMPALGVAGAGCATLVSRIFMVGALFVFVVRRDRRAGVGAWELGFSRARVIEIFKLGVPAAGQLLMEVGVFGAATLAMSRLGVYPLAAHQIVLQIATATFMLPLGLSTATAVRIGQAIGAGDHARGYRAGWQGLFAGVGIMSFTGITLAIFSVPILHLFTADSNVIQIGSKLLMIAACFQIFDGMQVVGTGALRGVGNTHASMFANMIGHWLLGLPIGLFLCFALGWGAPGLWLGLSIGLIFVALTLVTMWRRIERSADCIVAKQ